MATATAFNTVVSARTQVAKFIAESPKRLERWNALGGLLSDLESIIEHGKNAEQFNFEQVQAKTEGSLSTSRVKKAFAALQKEHSAILIAVKAMRADFAGQLVDVHLEGIVRNQATLRQVNDGTKRRRRSSSYEAVRAEIASDATSLLKLAAVADALARRRVTRERLEQLKRDATELTGKVGEQHFAAGVRLDVTKKEREAVAAQRARWGSVYPLLRKLAAEDAGVAEMLRRTTR